MIVTIPRFGNTHLAVKALFEDMQIPYIMPDINNKRILQLGVRVSPEDICLPFKIVMGSCLSSIEQGADTVIITGSCGPCRFGEYCELQMKMLHHLGSKANVIVIDAPSEIGMDELWRRISMISQESTVTRTKKLRALRGMVDIQARLDRIDAKAYDMAGYEIDKGECKRLIHTCKAAAQRCSGTASMIRVLKDYEQKLDDVHVDEARQPVRIALAGEIYSMIEPFANLDIESKLMDMGISTVRRITPSWWFKDLLLKPLKLNSPDVKRLSKQHLPVGVGGHARETIAHILKEKWAGADGAIQIFPLGCMPEIIAKAILPSIQDDDFPIMPLIIDEMTGEAGYNTRIEAFIDMLYAKRRKGRKGGQTLQFRH